MRQIAAAIAVVVVLVGESNPRPVAAACTPLWDTTAGNPGLNSAVFKLFVFDDGAGRQVYAAGGFTTAGGTPAVGIARWNGKSWSTMGDGLGLSNGGVWGMASFDDGSGVALYAGGDFVSSGGRRVDHIARWDGQAWQAVGGGTNAAVLGAMTVFDDGSGPALYAGGGFTEAGGSPASRIARGDGTQWTSLGDGASATVRSIIGFVEWGAPKLYAGGDFRTAGGVTVNGVARWDGTLSVAAQPTSRLRVAGLGLGELVAVTSTPDAVCEVADLISATKVLALAALELCGVGP